MKGSGCGGWMGWMRVCWLGVKHFAIVNVCHINSSLSFRSFTMTTNIHFKKGIKWPYGVMVSHQLDVLRVPRSILSEANLFLFLFFSLQNPSLVCFVHHSFFVSLQQQNDTHHNHRITQANAYKREQVWTGALVCFLWW